MQNPWFEAVKELEHAEEIANADTRRYDDPGRHVYIANSLARAQVLATLAVANSLDRLQIQLRDGQILVATNEAPVRPRHDTGTAQSTDVC